MTERGRPLTCDEADALAGAWGLGALERDEAAAVSAHLATCDRPHEELRAAIGAGSVLDAALEPMPPSAGLRARIMSSIGEEQTPRPAAGLPWYRRAWVPRLAAGVAAAAIVGLVAWNVQLRGQLEDRDAELRQVAAALSSGGAARSVTGSAGGGVLVIGEEGPLLVADVEPVDAGRLYEMWLIDATGTPVSVGTFQPAEGDALVIAQLEQPLEGFATFAVTVEDARVDAPTSDPVLVAPLTET